MGVPANSDGLGPARDEAEDGFAEKGLPEDSPPEDVPDGSVGTLPHRLQLKLFHTDLIRGDGGTFDSHTLLLVATAVDGNLTLSQFRSPRSKYVSWTGVWGRMSFSLMNHQIICVN